MGQAESSPGGHAHGGASGGGLHDPALPANTVAFHVLRVADNSPAADAGIEPFFDFVFGINQTRLVSFISCFHWTRDSSHLMNPLMGHALTGTRH